ncbi:MAG: Pathogenicity locus, partial [Bacteroidetes bacterium]|nr:Pathogenicity locus [Bacteroidota bacterium]
MKSKRNIKLPLTDTEKASLRKHKIKIANILDFAVDELEVLLNATTERAKEVYALAEFQTVPSVGIKFAQDLVFLGYYSLKGLNEKDGAKL